MKKPPHYELKRVYSDNRESDLEIIPVTRPPWQARMNRRGMLGVGFCSAAALAILTGGGCSSDSEDAPNTPTVSTEPPCTDAQAHSSGINDLTLSSNGAVLASGGRDKAIKLWSLPTGTLIKTLKGHTDSVEALAISPDDQILVSASQDQTIKLWKLPEWALARTLEGHSAPVQALAISPDNRILASGSTDKTIRLWRLADGTLLKTLKGHKEAIEALAISPDGQILASGSRDTMIKLWSLPEGRLIQTLKGHTKPIYALAINPDGKILVSGSADTTIKLWNLPDGSLRQTLGNHNKSVWSLAISSDGKMLVSGGNDFVLHIWKFPEAILMRTLKGHQDAIVALAMHPNNQLLVSGSLDKTIRLRKLPDGAEGVCLIDLAASSPKARGITYQRKNEAGQIVTYTQPCGSPILSGATCTCNCVPGTYGSTTPSPKPKPKTKPSQRPAPTYNGGSYCSCNKICTCIPVCQAHRVLHHDSVVRIMAEEILLIMGEREFDYMTWAARQAEPMLQTRIVQIMDKIRNGIKPDPDRWPSFTDCVIRLEHSDKVIALMAAQILRQKEVKQGLALDRSLAQKVDQLLQDATLHPWFTRS